MNILLKQNSDTPIYEQIELQIRSQILSGALKPGEMLPSLRALARDLRVSVVTVQKAYDNLIRTGFIETGAGIGTFVSNVDKAFIREELLRKIENLIEKAVELSRNGGIRKEEVLDMVQLYFKED